MSEIDGAAVARVLEEMMPRNLDDIIRANRNLAKLRLTSAEEVMALHAQIQPGPAKGRMENWRFITLSVPMGPEPVQVMLLGDQHTGHGPRISSLVRQIDLDRQLVVTNSGSLYELGQPGEGEPPELHLLTICSAFHGWGMGRALGVPPFFF